MVIIFFLLILLLAGIIAFFLLSSPPKEKKEPAGEKEKQEETASSSKQEEKEEKKQSKREVNNTYAIAKEKADPEKCNDIANPATRNNCIFNIALDTVDKTMCNSIKNQDRKDECANMIRLKEMKKSPDITKCKEMTSDIYTKKCIAIVADSRKNSTSEDTCNELQGSDRNYCEDNVNFNLATNDNDMKSCGKINNDSIRQECINEMIFQLKLRGPEECQEELNDAGLEYCRDKVTEFMNSDRFDFDRDGLNNAEEKKRSTDPYLKDTDGDGYNDKQEVEAGYDPAKN